MFVCPLGREKVEGNEVRVCQADGSWEGSDLVCQRKLQS